ncbi:MAG TPA: hypothetical protein VHN81_01335 [Edaphobacter sp.]|nr:hypothetical protein [Edaphobacter sp.]
MPEVTAFSLSKHFTNLINRPVTFNQATVSMETKVKKVFGVYSIRATDIQLVVKTDLALLGSLAGALLGLPDDEVRQRLKSLPLDDLLRDPMQEVLNVAAPVLSVEGQAAFTTMVLDPLFMKAPAQKALKTPVHRNYFTVEIERYEGGFFSIFEG